jgi:hypothetical protein
MVSMSLFYRMILSKKSATFWDHALERVPIKWNHLIDKDSLKIKELEHVLMRHRIYPMSINIEKVEQLFLDML